MRRIKSLGLGALMALALLAVPAGASAAGGIESESPQTTLYATTAFEDTLYLPLFDYTSSCQNLSQAELKGYAGAVSFAASEWSCANMTTFKMNGCKLDLSPGTDSVEIGPPGCGPVTTTFIGTCKLQLGAQSLPASYENVGEGTNATVEIDFSSAPLKYTREGYCGKGTSTGYYTGTWKVLGFDWLGAPTGIRAVDQVTQALYISGGEAPQFEAEQYPATISALQGKESKARPRFYSGPMNSHLECDTVGTTSGAAAATSALSLAMQYGGCTASGIGAAEVAMNSCGLEISLLGGGPPYTGETDIVCAKEGDAIETKVKGPFGTCLIKTGPQTGLKGVTFTNVGAGLQRAVDVGFDVKGITSTYYGGLFKCFIADGSTSSNNSYTGTTRLQAIVS